MVEAIIAISMMILFFGGMVFFQALYHQQIVTQNEAQLGAVKYAMGACQVNPSAVAGASETLTSLAARNLLQPDFSGVDIAGAGPGSVRDVLTSAKLDATAFVAQLALAGTDPVSVSGPNRFSQSTSSTSFATCSDELTVPWVTQPLKRETRPSFWAYVSMQYDNVYAAIVQNAYQ